IGQPGQCIMAGAPADSCLGGLFRGHVAHGDDDPVQAIIGTVDPPAVHGDPPLCPIVEAADSAGRFEPCQTAVAGVLQNLLKPLAIGRVDACFGNCQSRFDLRADTHYLTKPLGPFAALRGHVVIPDTQTGGFGGQAEPLLAFAQRFGSELVFGDVEMRPDRADRPAVAIEFGACTAGYPARFAGIWADDAKLVLDRFFRRQAGGDNAAHLFAVVGMDDVDPSLVSYIARAGRKSGLLREQLGDQDGPGLACLEIGEAGGLLHQAEALLAAAQGVLGFLALGDVEVSADGAHEVAALVALHLGVAGQPPRLAVIGADDAEFGLEPFVLAVERFLDRADDPGLVVRVQAIDPALHAYRAVAD